MESTSFLGPVDRESTPSIIAQKLRKAIAYGELAPGTQLAEAELARNLGVSRGPLREAMQRLTQEGILLSIRNRGLFVIELTEDDVADIYLARNAVERAAATEVLAHHHVEAAAQLRAITEQMAQADRDEARYRIGEADLAFHELLVWLSESPRLVRMQRTLLTETRMCVIALKDKYPDSDHRVAEHEEIVAAIELGDAALVDSLLISHMDDALGRLAPRFSSGGPRSPADLMSSGPRCPPDSRNGNGKGRNGQRQRT